ncbi:MAG: pilus assembly protein [Rhizomicrobium sp.]|nr:pilus assembly protein [Rhizomicrobium sp.]
MPQGAKTLLRHAANRLTAIAARLNARARSGSAAIEFALVAPVFFVFLMGTIETGIIFLSNFVLQSATNDAARQIRTGQVALGGITQAAFRQTICNEISPLMACDSNLQIDVETVATFNQAAITNPITASNTLDPSLVNWQPGAVCSVVLVRAFYTYSVATPFLTPFLVNINSTQHLLTAAVAFRNEPYTTAVAGC